ncbi:hypothetical protein [Microtetraspora fusca]|uniref:hypothetical protein n=1 Tax=Microtetraspora fusca TaxID=1997 RepID=UPI000829F913|nr:hypothetical protein [Microtetraspora fusca]
METPATEENLALAAEGLLALPELGGPEAVVQQADEMAGKDALGTIEVVLNSGHPADVGVRELRTPVVEPMRARTHWFAPRAQPGPGSGGRHSGHGK